MGALKHWHSSSEAIANWNQQGFNTDEHIELPTKLLDYFLRSNKSNINQYGCTNIGRSLHRYKKISDFTPSLQRSLLQWTVPSLGIAGRQRP